jgi:hypothetical protein
MHTRMVQAVWQGQLGPLTYTEQQFCTTYLITLSQGGQRGEQHTHIRHDARNQQLLAAGGLTRGGGGSRQQHGSQIR